LERLSVGTPAIRRFAQTEVCRSARDVEPSAVHADAVVHPSLTGRRVELDPLDKLRER